MSKVCPITGKKPRFGRKYTTRGISKASGGIGVKLTGITPTRFNPNLKYKVIYCPETGQKIRARLTAKALRTLDKVTPAAALSKIIGTDARKIGLKKAYRRAKKAMKA